MSNLSNLYQLLQELPQSQHPKKDQLIKALQARIADLHLIDSGLVAPSVSDGMDPQLLATLASFSFKELDIFLDSFFETGLTPPRELYQARQEKNQSEARALLQALIKGEK
jgi:hypothetical protein